MEVLPSVEQLYADATELGTGKHYSQPKELLEESLGLFRQPEDISTVEWAEKYRKFRLPDSDALVPYDRMRTPYNIAPSDALDRPGVELVVMPKPSRSGGTTIAENHLGKMIDFGPMGDVGWYLGAENAVKKYCERVIKPLFEDHPRLAAKIGTGRSDNNETVKRIAGHLVEWLPANDASFRNREFVFGVMDEPDGWNKFSESPETQLTGRQKNLGRRKKGMILSHPDKGWAAGVASAWVSSSRGIYVMRCVECQSFAAAHATKFWPDTPQFTLHYQRDTQAKVDDRLAMAERTAGMACPHCGVVLNDEQRWKMVDEAGVNGWWMHRGQTLDADEGIIGEAEPNKKQGFWVHGLMLKVSPAAELARGLEEALIKYERSGGSRIATKALREFMSKQLGEIFEGKAGLDGVDAAALRKRAQPAEAPDQQLEPVFPADALFITGAVDVGKSKFDLSFRAWDLEGRSWWLDRLTLKQIPDALGRMRDIATRERIDDWDILIPQAIMRQFPIEGMPDWYMPVAAVAIDVGDGNVVWKGREFARRTIERGLYWGAASKPWSRVRLIQGSPSPRTAEIVDPPREINRDENGRRFSPAIKEYTVGAHKLKELALDRLAITDGGPGYCDFAGHIEERFFDEYFNEPLIDGKFVRNGPNESLDLFAYEEAVRLMLKPDRKDIDWTTIDRRPPWARPVLIDNRIEAPDEQPEATTPLKQPNVLERFSALNNRRS